MKPALTCQECFKAGLFSLGCSMARNPPVTPAALLPRRIHRSLGFVSPSGGAPGSLVALSASPWRVCRDDRLRKQLLSSQGPHCRVSLNIGGLPGDQRAPRLLFQNLALSWVQSQLVVLLAKGVVGQLASPPTFLEELPLPRLSSTSPHGKRLIKDAGLALIADTTCAPSGPVKGPGALFSSHLSSFTVWLPK